MAHGVRREEHDTDVCVLDQVALDRAAHLMDAVAFGHKDWDGIREELAEVRVDLISCMCCVLAAFWVLSHVLLSGCCCCVFYVCTEVDSLCWST